MEMGLWTYLGAINLLAFALWGIDKLQAVRGRRRIAERTLLLVALLAGAPGAWIGVRVFRHKTRKTSFRWKLILVTALNGLWVAAGVWAVRAGG